MWLEPTTTEFHSDHLTDWTIKPFAQLAVRARFVQLLQFHLFVPCSGFISAFACISGHISFKTNLIQVVAWVKKNELMHVTFTTERFWIVAIASWLQWDFNPWSLNYFRRSNRLSYQDMSSTPNQSQLCTATPIRSLFSVCTFHFCHCLLQPLPLL